MDTDHHITDHRHIGLRQPADLRVVDLLAVDLLVVDLLAAVVPDLHPCLPEDSQRQANNWSIKVVEC